MGNCEGTGGAYGSVLDGKYLRRWTLRTTLYPCGGLFKTRMTLYSRPTPSTNEVLTILIAMKDTSIHVV
jgi:hypothetical protein